MSISLLVFNPDDPLPAYEQIKRQLRTQIAMGHLPRGTTLPSVRQLARDLGIAPNTVVHAYTDLEREHWITTRARKGVIVNPNHPHLPTEERTRQLDQAIAQLLTTAHALGVSEDELLAATQRHLDEQKQKR
jgi:DNA-binding transcriptional regulator YhcF (GntR family)